MKQLINPVNGCPVECDETGWPHTLPKPTDPIEQAKLREAFEWGSDHPNGCLFCRQDTLVRGQNGEYCSNPDCSHVMAFGVGLSQDENRERFIELYEKKFGPGTFPAMDGEA